MLSHQVFLQGLGLGASLIMAIGAQNAHVLRTAVRGQHVAATVAACIVIDVVLIALIAGGGALRRRRVPGLVWPALLEK
jgi:L-lysine exporter family protein LysE/ArgO